MSPSNFCARQFLADGVRVSATDSSSDAQAVPRRCGSTARRDARKGDARTRFRAVINGCEGGADPCLVGETRRSGDCPMGASEPGEDVVDQSPSRLSLRRKSAQSSLPVADLHHAARRFAARSASPGCPGSVSNSSDSSSSNVGARVVIGNTGCRPTSDRCRTARSPQRRFLALHRRRHTAGCPYPSASP